MEFITVNGLYDNVWFDEDLYNYSSVKISIASPEKIRSWSYGEVKKADTVNYKTFKPEKDGLFCQKIFGPVRDYECACGRYKKSKYKNGKCETCGVDITTSKVRRKRMGHIELACPICHIWFLKSLPSKLSILLDLTQKTVEKVVYFESYIVTNPKLTDLNVGQVLSFSEYEDAQRKYGVDGFVAKMGAEGIREILENMDLLQIKKQLIEDIKNIKSELKKKSLINKLYVVNSLIDSGNRPEWMILTVLPVIPPDLRPLFQLDNRQPLTSDLNKLYKTVIVRNNRLKSFIENDAHEIIIRSQKLALQEAVDALLDNQRSRNISADPNTKRPYKSLADSLKGKEGRFRQTLLGKRVDYSARSVIVVGPKLKLYQCGIPKKIALELFKPFIFAKLELYGLSEKVKYLSKNKLDYDIPELLDILDDVILEHPVLLNRAPTLHRLSIQAFEPLLVEGNAIQLHPLTCKAFNADFDGDQMAVHIPLSIEAQLEARVLMMSTDNVLSPQSGKPIVGPGQDMLFGLYYITLDSEKFKNSPVVISSLEEMEYALFAKKITLHDYILYRFCLLDENNKLVYKRVPTTPGRVKLFEIIPNSARKEEILDLVNKIVKKKDMNKILNFVCNNSSRTDFCVFLDKMMDLGFSQSCLSGLSIGMDDIPVLDIKKTKISDAESKVRSIDEQYKNGFITPGERYNKIIDIWSICSDELKKNLLSVVSKEKEPEKRNSLHMMIDSGARGSESQLQQMGAMRGLMTNAVGKIIETPILSNFNEGLSDYDYFISANIARKGLVDTALRTANAGYLTRRLVDAACDFIIAEHDCGTDECITLESKIENGRVVVHVSDRVKSKVIAKDVLDPNSKKVLIKKDTLVTDSIAKIIKDYDIKSVSVRSPLTCKCNDGICAMCYGADLTTGNLVAIGEAVGVIAAQAIGEPGTQLTMNTKHAASAGSVSIESSFVSSVDGRVSTHNFDIVSNANGENILISRSATFSILDQNNNSLFSTKVPYGSKVYFKDNDFIKKGDMIAEWDPYNVPIISLCSGVVQYKDLLDGLSLKEDMDDDSSISVKIVIDWKQQSNKKKLKPSIIIDDNLYELPIGAILNVNIGDTVSIGDVLAKIPRESSRNKDITGGLPRVSDLFEVRKPQNCSIIADFDGTIKIDANKIRKTLTIIPDDKSLNEVSYVISRDKYVFVNDGDKVKKADTLVDGTPYSFDILRILGIEKFSTFMINEIQRIYELQGIEINDKHFEVVFKSMLKKMVVSDPGDTYLNIGEYLTKSELDKVNDLAIKDGLKPAVAEQALLGLTSAALKSTSFISAASFQETTKVLVDSSILGRVDHLQGMKENVILGRLIPAGTGFLMKKMKDEVLKNIDE